MLFRKIFSQFLVYIVNDLLLLLVRNRLILFVSVRESEEHGSYRLYVFSFLKVIIVREEIIA
jgi:hypothetical protein